MSEWVDGLSTAGGWMDRIMIYHDDQVHQGKALTGESISCIFQEAARVATCHRRNREPHHVCDEKASFYTHVLQ